jgi:hypothetical protein
MDAARSLRSSKPVGLLHLREQSLPVTCARAFRADPLRGPMREEPGGALRRRRQRPTPA